MTVQTLKVPDELDAAELIAAMEHDPPPQDWPEGEKFIDAPQCAAISAKMIGPLHSHLTNARIGFVFREDIAGVARVVLAKASKPGGAFAFFSQLDFLITFNHAQWIQLEHAARCALVDHELSHFERDLETGSYFLVGHDLEEFRSIVRRWGFWKDDLVSFAEVVKVQLELFGGTK